MDATAQIKIDDLMQELDGYVIDWNDRLGARDIIARLILALPSLPEEALTQLRRGIARMRETVCEPQYRVVQLTLANAEALLAAVESARSAPSDGPQEGTMVPHAVMGSQIDAAVAAEREACARLAASYGPNRPHTNPAPSPRIIGRWEGEQAASENIARLIRSRAALPSTPAPGAPK